MRASYLEKENAILRTQVSTLREERNSLQSLLLRRQLHQKQRAMLNLVVEQQQKNYLELMKQQQQQQQQQQQPQTDEIVDLRLNRQNKEDSSNKHLEPVDKPETVVEG